MKTVDADCHVIENERTWSYMEGPDAAFRPIPIETPPVRGRPVGHWVIDGRFIERGPQDFTITSEESRQLASIDARLEHMDELDVDVQVLYPTLFLFPVTNRAEVELALCRSYNRWLADIWAKSGNRLRWTAVLPLMSMPEAIRELETAVQHGACGVFMRGFEVDRHLGDAYFFPLYEAAEGLNMPICAHAGNANFANFEFFGHAAGLSRFKMPVIDAFCSLILCNVPAQFPKLRFGFVEVTAQWVPYAIHFLAQRKKRRPALELANLVKENRMYVACQTDDDLP